MRRKHAATLTESDVFAIYGKFHYLGMTLRVLSQEYKVDQSTIGRVVRNESHKHVERPKSEAEWRQHERAVKPVTQRSVVCMATLCDWRGVASDCDPDEEGCLRCPVCQAPIEKVVDHNQQRGK